MRLRHRLPAGLGISIAIFLAARYASGASCTWDNSSNDWSASTSHWSCGAIPGSADSVTINGGTVTLSSAHSITGVTLTGGTIDGAGDLAVSGAFSWTGGTMAGTGTTTIAATSTLTINAGAVGIQRTLTNNGTITWVAGQLQLVNATINNNATFTAQADSSIANFGGTTAFNNNASGTFTRNTGSGTMSFSLPLTNAGTINHNTGTMSFAGGGTSTGSIVAAAALTVNFNSTFDVNSGTLTVPGTVVINSNLTIAAPVAFTAGTINLTGGTFTLNQANGSSTWNHSGGTLTGSSNVTVASGKTYSWTGGTMAGTGTTTIASGGILTINSGAVGIQRTLTNNGTITWVAGQLQLVNATINNNATFTAQADSSIANFGGTTAFNNNASGTFTRNTGSGTMSFSLPLTNAGTINHNTGTMSFAGGGTSTGSIVAAAALTVNFNSTFDVNSGTLTVPGTVVINSNLTIAAPVAFTAGTINLTGGTFTLNQANGSSTWNHSGGTLTGSSNVTVASGKTYSWTGGTMAGTGTTTIASGGILTINSGAVGIQRTLTNNGTITWVAGQLQLVNATINNNATFTAQPDNSIANFGGTTAFNNNASGTFTRNTGSGTMSFSLPLTNAGTINHNTGTMSFAGGGTSTGSIVAAAALTVNFNSTFDVNSGTLTVPGTVVINSNLTIAAPVAFTAGTINLTGGTFTLNQANGSSTWNHSGGTLTGSSNVTVASGKTYSWTGGTMAGTGTTTIASGGILTINSGAVGIQRTLTNNGTITWVAGQLQLVNATINNNATFTAQADSSIANFGGTTAFNNNASGTFTRNTGSGTMSFSLPLTNAGTINHNTGTMSFAGGGTSTGSIVAAAALTVNFNSTFDVNSGTLTVPGTVVINSNLTIAAPVAFTAGTINLTGGTFTLNQANGSSTWNHSGGTLTGSSNVTVASGKTYSWTGGTMAGTGTTTIASGGILTINSGAVGIQRTLTNNGTITWVAGQLQLVNATINNNATFTAQPDNSIANFGGTTAFNNNASGTFTRNTGSGTCDVTAPFNNAGTVNANSGTLGLEAFTQTGGFTILNGGNLSTNGALAIQGGTLKGNGTITGNVNNGGTVAPGLSPGTLTIAGNYSQTAGGTLAVEINGLTAGTQYDQLVVNGTVALAGTLSVTSGFTPSAGDGFAILVNDSTDGIIGDFSGLPESAVVTALPAKYRITYLGDTGNDVVLKAGPAASAQSLIVDPAAGAGSDGNGIFEPGETVVFKPSWKNQGTNSIDLTGSMSNFGGPAGSTYTVADGNANYGTLAVNATADCGSNCYSLFVTDPATRPVTHWDATITETPSTLADPPKVWTVHLGDSFTDVPRSQPFYKRIETLVHTGITAGCGVGIYCPNDAVARDQMGIFIAKGIAGGGPNVPVSGSVNGTPYNCVNGGTSVFTDVKPTDIFCKHVHYMAIQNVTLGCAANLYCPSASIARSDMAIFIAKALVAPNGGPAVPVTYGPDPVTGLSYSCNPGSPSLHFTDIAPSDNFCKHVHFLWAKGVITGCSGTLYCPTQGVTRDAMAKFLGNAFNLVLYGP